MFSNKLKTVSRSASWEISLFVWVFECLVEVCPEHEPWGWCATCFHLNNCCRRFSSNQKHVFFFHLNEEFLINKHSLSPLMQLYFNLRATDQKKTPQYILPLYFFPKKDYFHFLESFYMQVLWIIAKKWKITAVIFILSIHAQAHFWGRFRILSLHILIRFHFSFL